MTHTLTKKGTVLLKDKDGKQTVANMFAAEDKSSFYVVETKKALYSYEIENYFKEMALLVNTLFKKGEINLAAYLVLSRYISRRNTLFVSDKHQNAVISDVWDLKKLVETAKQQRGFKLGGIREK